MIQLIYDNFLIAAMCILALAIFVYFFRAMIGPHFSDRILAVNSISTIVILLIGIIGVLQGESYIIDICLIYAILGFVTVIILCKAYLNSHNKSKEDDLKDLKAEVLKDDNN